MELQGQPHPLRFQVLGPVQAWRGEQHLALGSPQQQAVLVALLLNQGDCGVTGPRRRRWPHCGRMSPGYAR
jgi:hypothetical protein